MDTLIEPIVDVPTIPHSREAEEAVLGAVLIDESIMQKLVLEPEDFYIRRNGMIFQAMRIMAKNNKCVDFVTLCAQLENMRLLNEVGGAAYIMGLINKTPSSLNAEGYADVIVERAKRRSVIYAAQKLAQSAYNLNTDFQGFISTAMDELAHSIVLSKGAVHISHFTSLAYDEADAAMTRYAENPNDVFGIPTGFADWDKITCGFQKGEVVLLAGEPGSGKSVLAVQTLANAARAGHPGALYELEMGGLQVMRRLLSAKAKIPTMSIRKGSMTEEELPVFLAAIDEMSNLPIYISDSSNLTTTEIRADLMRLKEFFGVELVVIDYIGLLKDAPDKKEVERQTLISGRVHDIAKDLDLAVIGISSMTKDGIKGETKGQGAVAGTATSLHDADQIIIIHKENTPNIVSLRWEKMREGENGRIIKLVKTPGYPMFGNMARI